MGTEDTFTTRKLFFHKYPTFSQTVIYMSRNNFATYKIFDCLFDFELQGY